jgi:cell division protease FtsH
VDEEIARMVEEEYAKTTQTLGKRRELLNTVANELLEKETLDEKEFKTLIGLTE